MANDRPRLVFGQMLREEWRLHSRYFSGHRFLVFPLLITALVGGTIHLLVLSGMSLAYVFLGLHGLAFLFGLHTGSIGLVGRDSLKNVIGDLTLLVFSARTLPLSKQGLLGVFVVKDLVYYALLFLLPVALGIVPGLVEGTELVSIARTVGWLWITLSGMFLLGIATTIALIGMASRGLPSRGLLALGVVGLLLGWRAGIPVASVTPYGAFLEPGILTVVGSIALLGVVLGIGVSTFTLGPRSRRRTVQPAYRRWRERVRDQLATKSLLDMRRSSGGFGKVALSGLILLLVTVALAEFVETLTGIAPSTGVAFGAILGLTGFTTYNWLTQFDDVETYLTHPLAVRDVMRSKFHAFLLVGPVVGLAAFGIGLLWRGARIYEAFVGTLLLVGILIYTFGVTVYLAGLAPNEFLFDTVLYATFGLALAVPLVPILVLGFVFVPIQGTLLALLGVAGVGLGILGVQLYRMGQSKWAKRYR